MEGESAWSERAFGGNQTQILLELGCHQPAALGWNRSSNISRSGFPFHNPSPILSPMNTLAPNGMKMLDRGVVR